MVAFVKEVFGYYDQRFLWFARRDHWKLHISKHNSTNNHTVVTAKLFFMLIFTVLTKSMVSSRIIGTEQNINKWRKHGVVRTKHELIANCRVLLWKAWVYINAVILHFVFAPSVVCAFSVCLVDSKHAFCVVLLEFDSYKYKTACKTCYTAVADAASRLFAAVASRWFVAVARNECKTFRGKVHVLLSGPRSEFFFGRGGGGGGMSTDCYLHWPIVDVLLNVYQSG